MKERDIDGKCAYCDSENIKQVIVDDDRENYSEPKGDHIKCEDCGRKQQLLEDIFYVEE